MSRSSEIITKMLENLALYMVYDVTDSNGMAQGITLDNAPSFRQQEFMVADADYANFFNSYSTGQLHSVDMSEPKNWNILFERYALPFVELEDRPDIRFARIAMYEDTESTTERVNDGRAHFSEQTYGIDISVIRAYSKDNETRGEIPLLGLRDKIVDWAGIINTQAVTENYLYTFTYIGASPLVRDDKFVSRTLTFTAIRDLHKPQKQ